MTNGKPGSATAFGWFTALLLSALLAGCGGGGGGGGGSATTTVEGTGAFGQPIVGGTVQMVCADNTPGTTVTTSATGGFTVTAPGSAPCVIKISGGNLPAGVTFYSIFEAGQTRANVNQLTTMLAFLLAGAHPETFFTSPSSIASKVTAAAVATHKAKITADVIIARGLGTATGTPDVITARILGTLTGTPATFDFLETRFDANGTGFDKLLDNITITFPTATSALITLKGTGETLLAANATGVVSTPGTTPILAVNLTGAAGTPATTIKTITAYSLAAGAGTATGTITGTATPFAIAVTVPNGTAVTALVATFTTTGASVKVDTAAQTSGTTANDFTNPVAYIVTAADGSTATYNVTVTVTASSAKAITAYSLAWTTGTPGSAIGTINQAPTPKTIAVTVPFGTNVNGLIATFTATPQAGVTVAAAPQTSGTTPNNFTTSPVPYIVTAADGTTATYNVTVTVAAPTVANPTAPTLGEAGRFVILAAQAVTTTGTTAISNGDIGITPAARSLMTGFTTSPETVSPKGSEGAFTELTNGLSYGPADANPAPFPFPLKFATPTVGDAWSTTGAMLTQAATDLGAANTFLGAVNATAPDQVLPIQLGSLTLTPGVYRVSSNVLITTGALQLDALGDANAVWIFDIAGTLTTGAPGGNITFVGGVGQAKNVFWRTSGITTIGAGTIFIGNVFAATQVNLLAGASVTGRLFGITDRVTLIANTVTKAP